MNTGPLETIGNYKVRDLLSGAFTDAGSTDITGITSAVQDGSDPRRGDHPAPGNHPGRQKLLPVGGKT